MSNSLRIKSVTVRGLFNQFDHHIDFNQQERITILHGINGVGKTTLLRMINDFFNFRIYSLNEIPFTSFTILLSSNNEIKAIKKYRKSHNVIELIINGKNLNIHHFDINQLIKHIPWVKKINNIYYDDQFDETLSLEEVIERYEDIIPTKIRLKKTEVFSTLGNLPLQFIEASRLLRKEKIKKNERHQRREVMTHTVKIYASELQQYIKSVMAEYGKKTQELEQTFPFRLLKTSELYTYTQLTEHIEELQEKRIELRDIGLLPETDLQPMGTDSIDDLEKYHAAVMNLYVKDSEEKLKVLESLSQKIKLLLNIINSKFQDKELRIDETEGLVIIGKNGKIDLTLLSSGEQQELVMFYDLIFKVEPNTLVMIDEPELSLHITWQNKFINELKQVVEQAKFDVLIATHSATIVGNNSHLMVGLGVKE